MTSVRGADGSLYATVRSMDCLGADAFGSSLPRLGHNHQSATLILTSLPFVRISGTYMA